MSTISGADVGRLRELGESMRGGADEIAALRARLDGALPALAWSGPDRERFAQEWQVRFSPALVAVSEALSTAGRDARGHADQQDEASSAHGGASGSTPAGPGAAADAAGTAGGAAGGTDPAADGVGNDRYGDPTGELSARYESRGDTGTVSSGRGDPGGVSYGTYQLSTTRGTAAEFVAWSREHAPDVHARLDGLTPGTAEFGTAWRGLAAADAEGFAAQQHQFVVETHYQPGVDRIVARVPEFTLEGRSDVVADVVWSTTVQHGARGAGTVFANALAGQDVAAMSDADLVRAIYAERGRDNGMAYFPSSRPNVRAGVVDRFGREQADALAQLVPGH